MSNAPVSMKDLQKAQSAGNTAMAVMNQPSTALQTAETASSATAAKMKAIVQARYEVAFFRPRDIDIVREKMMKECRRPGFADVARYNKPIGKGVVGPSIRFAEMAVRCMSNIVIETTTVYDDREKRIVNVSVTDLEGNVPYAQDVTISKAVERRKVRDGDVILRQRTNSYGDPVFLIEATDDEILNQQNALISKAIRTLGLRLVPGDLVDDCMDIVVQTQKDKDAVDPDAAKRKLFDGFAQIGVTVEQIKQYLGHSGEKLSPKELADLRGFYSAIRDGETTWREVVDGTPEKAKPDAKTTAKKEEPKKEEQKEQSAPAVDNTDAGKLVVGAESGDSNSDQAVDVERIKTLLKDATTTDEVMLIMKLAQSVPDAAIRAEISTMSNARVKEIRAAKKTVNEKPKTGSNQFE